MKYRKLILKLLSMTLVGCLSFVPMLAYANPTEDSSEEIVEVEEIEETVFPEDTIYLSSANDIIALAENCVLNTWSIDKTVVLNNDIDMSDVEFTGIPTFGGTFYGTGCICSRFFPLLTEECSSRKFDY